MGAPAASASARKTAVVGQAAARVATGFVTGLFDVAGGNADQPTRPRSLERRVNDTVVMVSEGSVEVTVNADWVDRRLAFTFALVGDKEDREQLCIARPPPWLVPRIAGTKGRI